MQQLLRVRFQQTDSGGLLVQRMGSATGGSKHQGTPEVQEETGSPALPKGKDKRVFLIGTKLGRIDSWLGHSRPSPKGDLEFEGRKVNPTAGVGRLVREPAEGHC